MQFCDLMCSAGEREMVCRGCSKVVIKVNVSPLRGCGGRWHTFDIDRQGPRRSLCNTDTPRAVLSVHPNGTGGAVMFDIDRGHCRLWVSLVWWDSSSKFTTSGFHRRRRRGSSSVFVVFVFCVVGSTITIVLYRSDTKYGFELVAVEIIRRSR